MEELCQTIDTKTAELAQEASPRQQMTQLLSQKEASYQATTEFAYICPQIEKMLKIPPEQWNAGFFNSWVDYVYPDDRDRVLNLVRAEFDNIYSSTTSATISIASIVI